MYVIMGYGKHQDGFKPYFALFGGGGHRVETNSLERAKILLKWQKTNNPYADWKIYKLEEVE